MVRPLVIVGMLSVMYSMYVASNGTHDESSSLCASFLIILFCGEKIQREKRRHQRSQTHTRR